MITAAQRERAVASFLCNPAWRAVYDGASDGAKEYLRLQFVYSTFSEELDDDPAFDAEEARVESRLRASDWRYLALSMAWRGGAASRIRRLYEAKLAACSSQSLGSTIQT